MEHDVFQGKNSILVEVTPDILVAINRRFYASILTTLEGMGLLEPGIKNSMREKDIIRKAIRDVNKANIRDFQVDNGHQCNEQDNSRAKLAGFIQENSVYGPATPEGRGQDPT